MRNLRRNLKFKIIEVRDPEEYQPPAELSREILDSQMAADDEEKCHPPLEIRGVLVDKIGEPKKFAGGNWVTLAPLSDDDDRLWEFDTWTGRIVQTRSGL